MTSQCVDISNGGDSRATSSASMAEYPPAPPGELERVREKLAAAVAKLASSTAREAGLRVRVGQLDLALQDRQEKSGGSPMTAGVTGRQFTSSTGQIWYVRPPTVASDRMPPPPPPPETGISTQRLPPHWWTNPGGRSHRRSVRECYECYELRVLPSLTSVGRNTATRDSSSSTTR